VSRPRPPARSVFAVVAGYLVFGLSAVILFQVAGIDPHAQSSIGFRIFSVLWGVAFALGAGFLAARLAPRRPLCHAGNVAALVAVAATVSLVGMNGAKWSQISALLLTTPSVVLGGWLGAAKVE
jgi:peptidoglycan/LPS O-acetylase OafA/YrhL